MFFKTNTKKEETQNYPLKEAGLIVDLRRHVVVEESPKKEIKKEKEAKKEKEIKKEKEKTKKVKAPNLLSTHKAFNFSFFKKISDEVKDIDLEVKEVIKNEISDVKKNVKPKIKRLKKDIKHLRLKKKCVKEFTRAKENILSAKPIILSKRSWYDIFRLLKNNKKKRRESSPLNSALSFLVFLIILIIPFKILAAFGILNINEFENQVMGKSLSGINSLMAAADSVSHMNLKDADLKLAEAGQNFLDAQEDLNQINDTIFTLVSLSSNPKMQLAANSKKFLSAGALTSSLGRNLIQATDKLFSGKADFGESLEEFLRYGRLAADDATKLKEVISSIDSESLPVEYREKFSYMSRQAVLMSDNLNAFVDMGENLKELLGLSRDKRYLLIFQNNSEMRGSGGFFGSYALVDVRDGKIRNLEVPAGGSYDLEAGLKGRKLVAPEPMWLVNPHWNFWDANWWPDFPKTAEYLMDFYEDSDGPSVDGVISLTPSVVEKMLEITGPIDMTAEYGIVISSENFWESVQKIVEYDNLAKTHPAALDGLSATSTPIVASIPLKQDLENNADNKPKKIIGDLMARMLEILPQKLNKENLPAISTVFEENVKGKHVLFYFKDEKAQAEMIRYGLAGEIKSGSDDYLQIVDTNIAGQKTDRLIKREASLETSIMPDGSLVNTLHIKRAHNGIKNEALTGVRNVNWLRIYVPQGSELISASGFRYPDDAYFSKPSEEAKKVEELKEEEEAMIHSESGTKIYSDSGKTVFANWTMTDPGEVSEIVLQYRLPFNVSELSKRKDESSWISRLNDWLNPNEDLIFPYSLLIQKQPGAWPIDFTISMSKPTDYEVFWRQEGLDNDGGDLAYFKTAWKESWNFDRDRFASVLFKSEK